MAPRRASAASTDLASLEDQLAPFVDPDHEIPALSAADAATVFGVLEGVTAPGARQLRDDCRRIILAQLLG